MPTAVEHYLLQERLAKAWVNDEGKFILANHALARLLDLDYAELLQRNWHEFIAPLWHDEYQQLCRLAQTESTSPVAQSDGVLLTHRGQFLLAFIHLDILVTSSGERVTQITILHAIPSAHLLHKTVFTDKLQQLGLSAAGICHDLASVLTPLKTHLLLLKREVDSDLAQRRLEQAFSCLAISEKFVRYLMRLSRGSSGEKSWIQLDRIVLDVLQTLAPQIPSRCTVQSILAPSLPFLWGDNVALFQLILNLCTNALEGMQMNQDHTLAISLKVTTLSPDHASKTDGWRPGAHLHLSISDTGTGIPAEIQSTLFDPFVTGKSSGTGLGLATVYRTVIEHHGALDFVSATDQGTTFHVYLPFQFPESDHSTTPSNTEAALI